MRQVGGEQIMGSSRASILVCDDEELIRWSVSEFFRNAGYRVTEAANGEEGLQKLSEMPHDLVITDLKMPKMGGLQLLRKVRCQGHKMPFIVLTAHGAVESAVEATQLGAIRYLGKPFNLDEVREAVEIALESHRLDAVAAGHQTAEVGYGRIIGTSRVMQELYATLRRLEAVAAPTVLLLGHSGTGKEVVAQTIHEEGLRASGPMVQVDCASLPEQLIESELFGHERGAFTDAKAEKRGMFEVARGGTIFLDEIGELSVPMQAKLLRVLENRTFRRVGGTSTLHFDASVIAATNRDLETAVKEGRFREDLFFRLKVIHVEVPTLRERPEDIPLLAEHFIRRFNRSYRKNVVEISGKAMRKMQDYSWPGNVRELRNVIERIIILEADQSITVEQMPPEIRYGRSQRGGSSTDPYVLPVDGVNLEILERSLLMQAMERSEGNQSAAARLLGISRYALRYRLEKHAKQKK
jgi:DNA-binding NtrC family response regulator